MNVTLRTSRFLLRPSQVGDAEPIARYLNDLAVSGNLARVPFPYHLSDAKAWLNTRLPSLPAEATNFAIDLPGEGLVGQVGFHQGPAGPIIGYWLGQPFWGRGIMTEAVIASLDWLFSVSATPAVYSGVFHFNAASLAIQTKLGFTQTGRSSLLCLARGAEVEHIDTIMTRSVWKARSK
jgi:RimJ/RimL family protein N-acetyltransferase